ncbi:hypothetical protein HPG69_017283 [Diceros bicornis minor]|uniref:Uncharacterized protein n=1 Tax=Diceros bicornis minor TaxID=77932 RepID=A0A7J7ECZ9_DICBM|nr:hypothetical protein HPG69_017283 [Diceros bicornis minor]
MTNFSILTTSHNMIYLNSSRNQLSSTQPNRKRIRTRFLASPLTLTPVLIKEFTHAAWKHPLKAST